MIPPKTILHITKIYCIHSLFPGPDPTSQSYELPGANFIVSSKNNI